MNEEVRRLAEAVRGVLEPSLLRPRYRQKVTEEGAHPTTGHCYAASEALYHLLGGREAGWTPMYVLHEGEPHWFLRHRNGYDLDVTEEQFQAAVPRGLARGKGFLTREPSARARVLMERVQAYKPKRARSR